MNLDSGKRLRFLSYLTTLIKIKIKIKIDKDR